MWDENFDDVDAVVEGKPRVEKEQDGAATDDSNARRNELVFIGLGMDEELLTEELGGCLLTDEETLAGTAEWERMEDPFPPWGEEVEDEDGEGTEGDTERYI